MKTNNFFKHITIIICFVLLISISAFAQLPDINYAFNIGSTNGFEDAKTTCYDEAGNMYVGGRFRGTTNFNPSGTGNVNPAYTNGISGFIAKYSNTGAYIWAIPVGTNGSVRSVTTDVAGNVYVTGVFSDTACNFNPLGTPIILRTTVQTNQDCFVAKYNHLGICQWAISFTSSGTQEQGNGITLDNNNNIYVTGFYSGTSVNFNPLGTAINLTSVGGADNFFAKYNNNGIAQWVNNIGSTATDRGWAVACDTANNVYLTGEYMGTVNFNPAGTALSLSSTSAGSDAFLAKYNSNGVCQWANSFGSSATSSIESGYGLAIDASSNVIVGGAFNGTVDFNPSPTVTDNLTSTGADAFLAKYTTSGSYLWALNIKGSGTDYTNAVACDANNNIFITGGFAGTNINFNPLGTPNNQTGTTGQATAFVSKYNTNGINQWARAYAGGSSFTQGMGIAVDDVGNFAVVGLLATTGVNFNFSGTTNLSTYGNEDIFIAAYYEGKTWSGATSASFATGTNWTANGTPSTIDNLRYPSSGITNAANWTGSSASGALGIAFGASFTLPSSSTLTLSNRLRNNGTLNGIGNIIANTFNPGIINPAGSGASGNLSISGNLIALSGSKINIELAGNGGAGLSNGNDIITVSGTAALNDTLKIFLINSFAPIGGQTFTLISATNVTDTFTTLQLPAGYTGYLTYTSTSVTLTISSVASVITSQPLSILSTSATLGGNVTNSGGATVTQRGVVYATTINPDTTKARVIIGSGTGSFSQNVIGLNAATLYHVRAYAINSVGISYGADSTFTTATAATLASVTTATANTISSTSATLGGNVTNSGGATVTQRGVVYATTINPDTTKARVIIGSGTGSFSQNVTGLNAATLYHVRAYAINSVGISYGADSTFTTATAATLASVTTAAANTIATTSATLGGNVLSDGGAAVTERGIVYAITSNPTIANTKIIIGSGTGSFSQNVTGLNAATLYHVRAYAINSVGISYGADSTFTTATAATLASVTTAAANTIATTSATLGGNVLSDGGAAVTERGIVYAITSNPTIANTKIIIGTGTGSFSQNVTGLNAATLYHVRAYAVNSVGISYGADSTFTTATAATLASVTTAAANTIATTSATLGGNVLSDGGTAVTERGVVYATTINPTTANTKVAMGTGLGIFSQSVTGLTPSTLYHVRAYAINSVGTNYGADSTFTTPSGISLPIITTGTATAISNTSATLAGNVISDGGTNVTERGIVFATTINPTTANNKVQVGTGTGIFSQSVTALTVNTTYHYRAYAINSIGISYGIDSVFITLPNPEFNKNITNAFSPDGDGINETWVIDNADLLNGHEIIVYNIFGQVVFSQTGYSIPWDGKKDGNAVPAGEYYYQIKGDKVNIKGALLIKTIQ